MAMRVGEHEILRDEFDVDEAACDELQVPGVPVALLPGDQFAHRAHFGGHLLWLARGGEDGGDRGFDLPGQARLARHDPRPRQRHALPGLGFAGSDRSVKAENCVASGPLRPEGRSLRSTSYSLPALVGAVSAAMRRCVRRA